MQRFHMSRDGAMESEEFDRIVKALEARRAVGKGSRRNLVRASLGAVAAAVFSQCGLRDVEGKKKRKKRRKKLSPPAPVEMCTGERPIACGPGCCSHLLPLCCPDIYAVDGLACFPRNLKCCTLTEGGGACLPGQKCCPPTLESYYSSGTCNEPDSTCCPSGTSGGFSSACPSGTACCPSSLSNLRNRGCCPALLPCCNVDSDCPGAHPCGADGCCEV